MAKNSHKSDSQIGRCGRGRKQHANMHSASAVQALFDVFVKSVVPETRSFATRRPGWRSFQTLDHLGGLKIAQLKCQEWSVKMWISTVDFMKAFDSISHRSLWDALGHCEIEPQYVGFLKRLYERQKRSVLTDKESDVFETEKGTKQGDPLSRSLSNTVLRVALKDDLAKWAEKRRGHTDLRFRVRLPHKLETRRRRALVCNIAGAIAKHVV